MRKTYTLNVAGVTRELPLCPVNEKLDIAAFVMFSDVELTVACAEALLKKVPEFDIIVTAEAKGIPLAYEMSRQSGKRYIPARKGPKLYMEEPVVVEDVSITTEAVQKLVIDRKDLDSMDGKRILIVDDVISTGGSLHALETLVNKSKGTVVARAAVLAEGDAADRKDIIYLEPLPPVFQIVPYEKAACLRRVSISCNTTACSLSAASGFWAAGGRFSCGRFSGLEIGRTVPHSRRAGMHRYGRGAAAAHGGVYMDDGSHSGARRNTGGDPRSGCGNVAGLS